MKIDMCNVTSARGTFTLIIHRLAEPALAVDFDAAYFLRRHVSTFQDSICGGKCRSRDIPRRSRNDA